jgi:hypothetical protein
VHVPTARPSTPQEISHSRPAHADQKATHHVFWYMSDRGIPRSFRTMEGFGVHTFRLVNASGETRLVKFHWKPVAGVHSLVWEEAQIAAGCDPDFHRRDMADGIEAGVFLDYEFGIQVMRDDGTDSFEGIDLLDPTKLVPEELAPAQLVGKLTLNRNPTNYFAETEQVAFHTCNLVPRHRAHQRSPNAGPLVIAPVGGVLKAGRRTVTVDRTLATARSIEFDALVVAGALPRPVTSNSSLCSKKRSATARQSRHGATAAPYSSLRASPAKIRAWRWLRRSIRPLLRICHGISRSAHRLTVAASTRRRRLRKLGLWK